MKNSIIVLLFFIIGITLGRINPNWLDLNPNLSSYTLYLLMFLVGIGIGRDKNFISNIRKINWRYTLLPLATILGTLSFAIIASFLVPYTIKQCLAISAGFGYYSLSSIIITKAQGVELGTVALISNVIREIVTLVLAPYIALIFGKLAPISVGGATTMDSTLPIISKVSGQDFIIISMFHGFIVDFSVPLLVSLLCI